MKNCLRVISVLLCLMLCLALCPVTAESTYDETRLTEAVSLLNGGRSGVLPEEYTVQVDPKALGAAKGLSKKVLNLLFVGMDTDGAEGNGPGDLVLLCSIQTKTGEVTLVNLDEALLLNAEDIVSDCPLGLMNALGGPLLCAKAINESLGLNISQYICLNYNGFITVIDALGGVEMTVTEKEAKDMSGAAYGLGAVEPGTRTLSGAEALAYCRIATSENGSSRGTRQRALIETLFRKMTANADMRGLLDLFTSLLHAMDTNVTTADLVLILTALMRNMQDLQMASFPSAADMQTVSLYGMSCKRAADPGALREQLHALFYGE